MPEQVVLAVRGEARHSVAPDHVVLHGRLSAFAPTKGEALAIVRAAQDELTAALRRLGGVPLAVETERADLTWSMGSVTTPKALVPAFRPSTTTTATLSFGLCARTWGMLDLRPATALS